jgi:hypothetical protein
MAWIDGPNPGHNLSRRMPHPFQIRATLPNSEEPEELMIDWGNTPKGSTASVYLPAVSAAEVLQRADRMYTTHLLRVEDAHTVACRASGVTFIPIPEGTGMYAGLITLELPAGIQRGDLYEVAIRQVTSLADTGRRPGFRTDTAGFPLFSWRQVLGAFRISMPISTKDQLLLKEERLLAVLRWIAETMAPNNRWYRTFHRYLAEIAGRVKGFGGDPTLILPSPTGQVPSKGPGKPGHPPGAEVEFTGKVEGIMYDSFGDFEGFILELHDGERLHFASRENEVWRLVHRAWLERIVVTVAVRAEHPHLLIRLVLRGAPPQT